MLNILGKYHHIQSNAIASGPHAIKSAHMRRALSTGNPELLSQEAIKSAGYYPEWREEGDAPIGYQSPQWEPDAERVAIYRKGTEEERDAAALQQRREAMQCTPIQGELALIAFGEQTGQDIIGGYDAWRTSPDRTRLEKAWVERTTIWKRLDPHLLAGAAAVGITDDAVLDQLFELAVTL